MTIATARIPMTDGPTFRRMLITPTMAQAMLESIHYEHQRHVRDTWVQTIAEMMRRGEWLERDPLKIAVQAGREYLIDGQHRLMAVVEADQAVPFPVLYVPCATMADVLQHYGTIDTNLSRSLTDILPAMARDLGAFGHRELNILSAATVLIHNEFRMIAGTNYVHKSRELRRRLLEEWGPEAKEWFTLFSLEPPVAGHIRRTLMRRTVIAVALVTLRYQGVTGRTFWRGMAIDDGLHRDDPRKALLNYLLTTASAGAQVARESRIVAGAWNAWNEGRAATRVSNIQDPSRPIGITGTPYTTRGFLG